MSQTPSVVWNKCLSFIKDNIQPQAFKTWFEPIIPVKLTGNVLSIQVPSKFFYEWLEEHYVKILRLALTKELGLEANFAQSNIEGEIVSLIQNSRKNFDGIIINAAGFTHTSVAIRDALSIFKKPIIELHISNIYRREEFRHKSLISDVVTGGIFGLGADGYILAIISMQKLLQNEN